MKNILYPEWDKDRQRFGGQGAEGINLSHAKRHSRVQTVHLLKFQDTKLTQVLSRRGEQGFGVVVELFLGIRRMHKSQNGKHHSLIPCGQIVEKLLHFLFLLFHIIRHGCRKVVVGILSPLPIRYIRFNPKQAVFCFFHRFIGGNRHNVNRHHQVTVQIGQLGYHTILNIGGVFP